MKDTDFYRTMTMVIVALGVLFVAIVIAANMVTSNQGPEPVDPRVKAKIDASIQPVGKVNTEAGGSVTPPPAGEFDAAGAYQTKCFACHGTGAAGAPKVGDKAAWKDRIAAGIDALVANAIKGKGAMPPKGGHADLNDDQVKAIVEHMVNNSK